MADLFWLSDEQWAVVGRPELLNEGRDVAAVGRAEGDEDAGAGP